MTAALQIQLFGGLRVALDGVPVKDFYSIKAPALLAYLAVTRRAPTRDTLAALFWGDMSDADAKTNLRQALANLRKLLGPYLLITRDTVEFNFDAPCLLDVEQFETKLRAENLTEAVALYKGDFLDGVFVRDAPAFEEWALAQRARLRELTLQALHTLVAQHAARGEYLSAIDYVTRLLALDAWREEAHRQLMLLFARSGQHGAALAQYETCRRILNKELGVAPSAETTALYERIRAVASADAPRHNLPPQPTSFVGRAHELMQIEALLLKPDCRLVTILGAGGVGKTRLALQAAEHSLRPGAFLNGVFFVSLVGVDGLDRLAPAMAQAFGLSLARDVEPQTQIVNYLRAKEMLVVLDNLEALLEASRWLVELLHAAPRVKLLVTSREKLNVRWEWVVPLEGIAFPRAPQRADAAQFDAVRLYVARAQQAAPAFALDETTTPCVARVCELVEGLPLGIELAAAWSAQFTCDEIAREIERSYDFLTTTLRDQPARQQSLRAVFEYAWQRLAEPERAVYARLSLFQNGFTRDAAQQVAHASSRALTGLIDKALLRRDATGRYDLHPVLRQYAREKLDASREESFAAQDAHSAYYLQSLRGQEASLQARAQRASIESLSAENGNLRAAWRHAAAHAQWTRLSSALTGLSLFYDMTSQFLAARGLLDQTLAALETDSTAVAQLARAWAQAHNAYFCGRLAEPTRARTLAETALANLSALASDTRRERAFCLNTLGNVAHDTGDEERAEELCRQALALRREIEDWHGILGSLLSLGGIAWRRGEFQESRALMQEGIALSRTLGDQWGTARFLSGLGVLDNSQGNLDEALQLFPESLTLYQALGDSEGAARVMFNLGVTHYHRQEFERARELFQASLDLRQDLGDRLGIASCIVNLGEVAKEQQDFLTATRYFQSALELFRAINHKYGECYALKGLGETALPRQPAQAEAYFLHALQLAIEIQFVPGGLELFISLARVAEQRGDAARARQLVNSALQHPAAFADTRAAGRELLARLAPLVRAPQTRPYEDLAAEILNA